MGDLIKFFSATAILMGTCIGAGVLGIPYVAAKSGFSITLGYIIFLGLIILLMNLYFGEICLRTKTKHHLAGYTGKYLGKNAKRLMKFATIFGIYSAIIAYLFGVGNSLSFLFYGNSSKYILFGLFFGIAMSFLLKEGILTMRKYQRFGVAIVILLLIAISFLVKNKINLENLTSLNIQNIFLPLGVVLFSLLAFSAIPELRFSLFRKEKLIKKSIITGTILSIIFYILFTFIVVGFKGIETPEIATLAMGNIFIFFGIFTMFTAYFVLGNALRHALMFDSDLSSKKAWFFSAIVPLLLFIITQMTNFFSFTRILSLGGVISGGITGILILLVARKAKKEGDRKPEYSVTLNWIIITIVSLIFLFGLITEIFI